MGEAGTTSEFAIDGLPVALPVLDILTVGAGGGSIARVDAGGALTVGPESAGALPGPISYGRGGTEVAVTDAHVLLGRLPPERFLGGGMRLHPDRLAGPFERLAKAAGMRPVDAALGVLTVVEANMARAIRVISLERGHDPADFTLVAFGGAGGLHAARLAQALSMRGVLIPPAPGAFSAFGMATADVVQDASAAVLAPVDNALARRVRREAGRLEKRLVRSLAAEGIDDPRITVTLDLRYRGQSFEVPVELDADLDLEAARERFHEAHERLYRARHDDRTVEAVALHVRAAGSVPVPEERPRRSAGRDPKRALDEECDVLFTEGPMRTAFYSRDRLRAGHRIAGPAVVTETTGTTVVPPGHSARVDRYLNLLLTPPGGAA
jgi:N-methylhydantoinase A